MQALLTAIKVKDLVGISAPTLYRLHDAGILPAVEVARRERKRILRWRPETVERFIKEREGRVKSAAEGTSDARGK